MVEYPTGSDSLVTVSLVFSNLDYGSSFGGVHVKERTVYYPDSGDSKLVKGHKVWTIYKFESKLTFRKRRVFLQKYSSFLVRPTVEI